MKYLLIAAMLYMSSTAFSQNGYTEQVISVDDTSAVFHADKIYWKLLQGVNDYILESKLNIHGNKVDVKHPIISRKYDGYIKEFAVLGRGIDNFTIRFHTGNNTVTYIHPDKTVVYRGKDVKFDL